MGYRTAFLLAVISLVVLGANGQRRTPKPSALTNAAATVKQTEDKLQLAVDFDYSANDACKCTVKMSAPKRATIVSFKQCLDAFTITVTEGTYRTEIKCKKGRKLITTIVSRQMCADLDAIPNGSVDTSGSTPDSTATYTCDEGYEVRGEATRTCQNDGTWSGVEPKCGFSKKKMCDSVNALTNGFLSTSNQGSCIVSNNCLNVRCTGTRSFGPIPNVNYENSFQFHPCANPPAVTVTLVTGGNVILDQTLSETTTVTGMVGNIPFSMMLVVEQMPSALVVSAEVTVLGQKLALTPGAKSTTICLSADCDCGHPGEIDNGEVDVYGGTEMGDTATYSCNEGFDMVGEMTRTCEDTGMWGGEAPKCLVSFQRMCRSVRRAANYENSQVTSECTVSEDCTTVNCDNIVSIGQGVEVTSTSVTRVNNCQPKPSLWIQQGRNLNSFTLSPCDSYTYSSVNLDKVRTTSSISVEETPTGMAYTFKQTTGDNTTVTEHDIYIACLCQQLPDIDCGTVVRPATPTVGTVTSYTCDGALKLAGNKDRVCMPYGEWSGDEPSCETTWEAMCMAGRQSFELALAQEHISGSCKMSADCLESTCDLMVRIAFITANVTMTSSPLPCSKPYGVMIRSESELLGDVLGGTFTESTEVTATIGLIQVIVNYEIEQMDKGITLEVTMRFRGSPTVFTVFPLNKLVMHCSCPQPDPIKNGGVSLSSGYEIESVAFHYCNSDFELEGGPARTCQPGGTWSGQAPVCKPSNKKPMCDSIRGITERTLSMPMISGTCNVSADCTMTECSVTANAIETRSLVTYNPCSGQPYSIRHQISLPALGVNIDETTSEDSVINIGPNEIRFTIAQGEYCVEISVTATFFGNTFAVIPKTTVDLYCSP